MTRKPRPPAGGKTWVRKEPRATPEPVPDAQQVLRDALARALAPDLKVTQQDRGAAEKAFFTLRGPSANPATVRTLASVLKHHPRHADALQYLAHVVKWHPDEQITIQEQIVRAAELDLGEATFKRDKGVFWLAVETRPFMRALERLAMAYHQASRLEDEKRALLRALELNPMDNQGLRGPLLGVLLQTGDLSKARQVLEQFPDDAMAATQWSRVLERVLSQDQAGAKAALAEARKWNPYVLKYLLQKGKLPPMPSYYSPGDDAEARVTANEIRAAWEAHPEAQAWLKAQK